MTTHYFSKHLYEAYKEDAANPVYPPVIRVTFLAYGNHKANGHARFKQLEVANALGAFDEEGTFLPASKYVVNRAIRTAIAWGLLAEGSKALCLIVPGHRIQGYGGDADAPCDRHRKVAASRNKSTPKVAVKRDLSPPKVAATRHLSGSIPSLLLMPVTEPTTEPSPPRRTA